MTRYQVGDKVIEPYPDHPGVWMSGTVTEICADGVPMLLVTGWIYCLSPEALLNSSQRCLPAAAPKCFTQKPPLPSIIPPSLPHQSSHQGRRARRRNRKRSG